MRNLRRKANHNLKACGYESRHSTTSKIASKINHRKNLNQAGMTEIAPLAYKKLMLMSLTFSAISVVGLCTTSWRPDSQPRLFAFSLSWVINVVVFQWTRDYWLRMDPKRFRFASWEEEGRLYRWAGVDAFRWLLLRSPLSWLSPTLKLASPRTGLERLLRHFNCAEGVHRVGGVVTLGVATGYVVSGHAVVGFYIALVALLLHVYPVMLQRRNRGHVLRLARRLDELRQNPRPA
jgi:Glycosyl-4,4'-diaponeurosporenoate acyltransferase